MGLGQAQPSHRTITIHTAALSPDETASLFHFVTFDSKSHYHYHYHEQENSQIASPRPLLT